MTWYSSTGMRPVRLGAGDPAADGAATSPGALLRAVASLPVPLSAAGARAAAESVEPLRLEWDSPPAHAATSGSRRASVRRSISDLRGDKRVSRGTPIEDSVRERLSHAPRSETCLRSSRTNYQ